MRGVNIPFAESVLARVLRPASGAARATATREYERRVRVPGRHERGLASAVRATRLGLRVDPGAPAVRRGTWLAPLLVCVAAGVYLSGFAYRGWIPHDEGTLAHCAERVLAGELPHRDFDDMYTGGLSYLNAAAFKVLGVRLTSIRVVFFLFAIGFVGATYAIAARAAPPWVAGAVALACMGWSVPNYFAALPSWYTLFFATFGLLSLIRYVETHHRRWLFLAGLWGGLGILAKIVAVYYLAAAVFFLVYRFLTQPPAGGDPRPLSGKDIRVGVAGAVSVAWLGLLWALVHRHAGVMLVLQFVVPSLAVCAVLLDAAWRNTAGVSRQQLQALARELMAFSLGTVLPVACFLVPFVLGGAIGDWYRGVFVTPRLRLAQATYSLPSAAIMILEIPVAGLLAVGLTRLGRWDAWLSWGLLPALAVLLWQGSSEVAHQLVFLSVSHVVPVVAVLAAWLLVRGGAGLSSARRQELLLVTALMAFVSLVRFPFAAPIYFCYTAPLVGLAAQFYLGAQPHAPRRLHLCLLMFCLVFSLGFLNRRTFFDDPRVDRLDPPVHTLALHRAGLCVSRRDKDKYEALVRVVRERSWPGSWILATPDCPEVYFLADRRNPTRAMFELFDRPEGRTRRHLELIAQYRIPVVVLNLRPGFSQKVDPEFVAELSRRFPCAVRIDNFIVAYRGGGRLPSAPVAARGVARSSGRAGDAASPPSGGKAEKEAAGHERLTGGAKKLPGGGAS